MTNDLGKTSQIDEMIQLPRRRELGYLAIGFLVADYLVLSFAHCLPVLRDLPSDWNWSGKITSIAFSCTLLGFWPRLRKDVGLHWRQSRGSKTLSICGFLACLAVGVYFGFAEAPIAFSGMTFLFQFFMPGIDEEIAFRGIAMALIERAAGKSPQSDQLRYGKAALYTSLVFGLAHAISFENGHLGFALFAFFLTGLFASLMAIVRTRSGSLLWPILSHCAWDGTLFFVRMLR